MRYRGIVLLLFFALCLAITIVAFPGHANHSASSTTKRVPSKAARVTRPSTTTTTISPGDLPQTKTFPNPKDPVFIGHMRELVAAIAGDRPKLALDAFFPLAAYIQVKAIADPVTDWHVRLIANYAIDIGLAHRQLGPDASAAKFKSVAVGAGATWIKPGVELNKGSYWRVYGTVVYCKVGSATRYFVVTSMISWRGEWYVVHLGAIR
ncbi:MAG TPA: hypothetical protein VMU99_09985 [Acidimicrobiales bacterium]|nr:hypothetical protein [Acidimicrobiales bacterium]